MADSSGKIDVLFEKDGKNDKLFLSYTLTPGDRLDRDPTFSVTQTLGWKDAKGDPKTAVSMRVIDASQVAKRGGKYSFKFELDTDVTDLVVKTYADPPKSLDDPTIHQDEDQIALGKDLLNKKTVTVLKVVGGKVEPHIVEFSGTCTDADGNEIPLGSREGTYSDEKLAAAMQRKSEFPPHRAILLKWKVEELGDLKLEFATQETSEKEDPAIPDDEQHKHIKLTKKLEIDVTILTDATTGEGSLTWKHPEQNKYPSFRCDLRLKNAKGAVLKSQTICAYGKYPLPEFQSFQVTGPAGGATIPAEGGKIRLLAQTIKFAKPHSIWVSVFSLAGQDKKLIEQFRIKEHGAPEGKPAERDLDMSRYPKDGSLEFRAAIFGQKGPSGSNAAAKAPWNKVPDEGAFVTESEPQQLKIEAAAQPRPPPPKPKRDMAVGFNYTWAFNRYGTYFGVHKANPELPASPPAAPTEPVAPGEEMVQENWLPEFRKNLVHFSRVEISVVRVFLLCNGLNWGTVEGTPGRVVPPKYLHPRFLYHLKTMLQHCQDVGVKIIPSLLDFGIDEPDLKSAKRTAIITDDATQKAFLDGVLDPFLDASDKFRDVIYAWEVMNEPSWVASTTWPGGSLWKKVISHTTPGATPAQIVEFLKKAIARIDGKGFQSTVGHRFFKDLSIYPTGTLPQFHFYPRSTPPPNDDPRELPPAGSTGLAAAPFLGEFGLGEEGEPWWECSSKDIGGHLVRARERLRAARRKGYKLALMWADLDYGEALAQASAPLWDDPPKLSLDGESGFQEFMKENTLPD